MTKRSVMFSPRQSYSPTTEAKPDPAKSNRLRAAFRLYRDCWLQPGCAMSGSVPPVTFLTAEAFKMLDHTELQRHAPTGPIGNAGGKRGTIKVARRVAGGNAVTAEIGAQPSTDDWIAATDKTLLLLNDDTVLCCRLHRVFDALGFNTTMAASVPAAVELVRASPPAFALLGLRLKDGCGLEVMKALREERPHARIIMLTGYGNIATAVAAIRGGAADYLVKPANDDDVVRAVLGGLSVDEASPPKEQAKIDDVRWEHIHHVYELYGRNVSETARRLGMHRRTLQRTLARHARS
jgi:two-component system response regulator RegA